MPVTEIAATDIFMNHKKLRPFYVEEWHGRPKSLKNLASCPNDDSNLASALSETRQWVPTT